MKKYYQAENYGHGFITHEDNEYEHVAGYPGNVWVTKNEIWAQRIQALELTKEQAQALVDQAISGSVYFPEHSQAGQQIVIELP